MADDDMELAKEEKGLTARKRKRIEWRSKHAPKNKKMKMKSEKPGKPLTKKEETKFIKAVATSEPSEQEESNKTVEISKKRKRYILFIGNLPFTVKEEDVISHFRCTGKDNIKQFRLMTKRTGESKGCGFLEFKNKHSYWKALNLHHSVLAGRKINVEVTCGGGGHGVQRKKRLEKRKAKFRQERKGKLKSVKVEAKKKN
ncbi:uncharacterized protein [Montipora capricornis]|uniref:uncharacterized protein n=1 Tax=Montipora capricornis TaxID=246305 RepID=UPI0035F18A12